MHLILTGATGLLGSAVLDTMIRTKEITRISIVSRRPVQMANDRNDSRINVIIHKDFESYPPDVLEQLKGATGVVWALGIGQNEVGKEEYIKITKDFALAAAKAFQTLPTEETKKEFNFVYVSGNGATLTPGRFTPIFGRVKGETELALAELRKQNPFFRATSVRPGWIDAAAHTAIQPYIPAPGMVKGVAAFTAGPVIRRVWQDMWSPTEQLGRFLVDMAMGTKEDSLQGTRGIEKIGQFTIVDTAGINANGGL